MRTTFAFVLAAALAGVALVVGVESVQTVGELLGALAMLGAVGGAVDEAVLADCIATYQHLGCWTPHVEITPEAFEVTLDVFEHFGTLKERYSYDQVCAAPPA